MQRFASDHLITAYVEMLETLHTNGAAINHMIVRLLHRFFVTLNLQGFFYKVGEKRLGMGNTVAHA